MSLRRSRLRLRVPPWFDEAGQDVRYAARTLRKNLAFVSTAAATLSLAIGATPRCSAS